MTLLGATTAVRIARAARASTGPSRCGRFDFSLDPGTGPTEIAGTLDGLPPRPRASATPSGERTETRELAEAARALAEPVARARRARASQPGADASPSRSSIRPRCATRR